MKLAYVLYVKPSNKHYLFLHQQFMQRFIHNAIDWNATVYI